MLREFTAEVMEAPVAAPTDVLGLYELWHRTRKSSGDYSERTLVLEERLMKNVLAHIGKVRLKDLDAAKVEAAYASLREGDTASGRPLSGSTMQTVHRFFTCMVHWAERRAMLPRGTLDGLSSPKNDSRPRRPLSEEEAERLAGMLAEPKCAQEAAIVLYLEAGLRRSEALVLEWDKTLTDDEVIVDGSADESGEKGSTKTRAGVRAVPLSKRAKASLEHWRKVQQSRCPGCSLVVSEDGTPIKPSSITLWWR